MLMLDKFIHRLKLLLFWGRGPYVYNFKVCRCEKERYIIDLCEGGRSEKQRGIKSVP
jgi:hypothetical protein